MESDREYLSDEEEYYSPTFMKSKNVTQKQNVKKSNESEKNSNFKTRNDYNRSFNNNPFGFNQNQNSTNVYSSSSQQNPQTIGPMKYRSPSSPQKYDVLRSRILSCFNDGVIIPVMNVPLIYSEKFTTMFDYKNGGCIKGVYHRHKTVQKYFACCTDTFVILNLKFSFIRRCDKEINEKIKRRIEQHISKVSKASGDRLMHIEMLILTIFASKTTVTIEDMECLFFNVYNIRLNPLFLSNKPLLKSIQLMNSPNMRVSITQKASNIICIPPSHIEFHSYKNKTENYNKVLAIEDKISRTSSQTPVVDKKVSITLPKIKTPLTDAFKNISLKESTKEESIHTHSVSNATPSSKNDESNNASALSRSRIEYLLSLTDLNIPKIIQKSDLNLPTPSELYKEINNEIFFHCVQSLKLDENEDQPFIKINPRKKSDKNDKNKD